MSPALFQIKNMSANWAAISSAAQFPKNDYLCHENNEIMNDENLKGFGFQELTASEQREIASMGGKASVAARREKKKVAELVKTYMAMPSASGKEGKTMMDDFIENALKNSTGVATLDDVIKLQRIIGEDVTKIQVETDDTAMQVAQELKEIFGYDRNK